MGEFMSQHGGEFFSALMGAFFGALMAYLFAHRLERARTLQDQHAAGLDSQRVFLFQRNILENIVDFLNKHKEKEHRETEMPSLFQPFSTESIDFKSLIFLLPSENANIVQEIYLAEQAYKNAVDIVKFRNRLKDNLLLSPTKKIKTIDEEKRTTVIEEDKIKLLILKDVTDSMFSTVDNALSKNTQVFEKYRTVLETTFPKLTFPKYSTDEKKSSDD